MCRRQVRVFDQKSQGLVMLKRKKGTVGQPALVSPKCLVPPFLVRLPGKEQRGTHLPTGCFAAFQILTILLSQLPFHVLSMCSKWLMGSVWKHSPENPEMISAKPLQFEIAIQHFWLARMLERPFQERLGNRHSQSSRTAIQANPREPSKMCKRFSDQTHSESQLQQGKSRQPLCF